MEFERRLDELEGRKVAVQQQALRFDSIRTQVLTQSLYEIQSLSDDALQVVRRCRSILASKDPGGPRKVDELLERQGLVNTSEAKSGVFSQRSPIGKLENSIQLAGAELVDAWMKIELTRTREVDFSYGPVPPLAEAGILAAADAKSRRIRRTETSRKRPPNAPRT